MSGSSYIRDPYATAGSCSSSPAIRGPRSNPATNPHSHDYHEYSRTPHRHRQHLLAHYKAKSVSAIPQHPAISRLSGAPPPHSKLPRSSSSSQATMSSLRQHLQNDNHAASSSSPSSSRSSTTAAMRRSHSTRSHLHSHSHSPSPSVLPPTEGMSYFPPFEAMGSDSVLTTSLSAAQSEAGPSTTSRSSTPDSASPKRSHSKGRSLTSLAGIISPLWSMTVSASPAPACPASRPSCTDIDAKAEGKKARTDGPTTSRGMPRSRTSTLDLASTNSDTLLEALSRRCAQIGSRRVLEPVSTTSKGMDMDMDEMVNWGIGPSLTRTSAAIAVERKRRMRSEYEVEGILGGASICKSMSASAGSKEASTKCLGAGSGGEEEVCAVERLVTVIRRPSSRRAKPNLSVPLPTFPTWRFPLPSPPITSLSPDIPNLAFKLVDNPLTSSFSTSTSSSSTSTSTSLYASTNQHTAFSSLASSPARDSGCRQEILWKGDGEDLDAIDVGLGGLCSTSTTTSTFDSDLVITATARRTASTLLEPVTPPRKRLTEANGAYSSYDGYTVETGYSDFDNFLRASACVDRKVRVDLDTGVDAVIVHAQGHGHGQGMYLKPRLERIVSSASTDSKETIRPAHGRVAVMEMKHDGGVGSKEQGLEMEGEVTPKASALLARVAV